MIHYIEKISPSLPLKYLAHIPYYPYINRLISLCVKFVDMDMMYHKSIGKDENQLATTPKVITSSASSSPSHEFSFAISLYPNSTYYPKETNEPNRTISLTSPFLDLSPADDIFFRGQLLPLHHLSHLPSSVISPRSSTTSLENFTLPEIVNDGTLSQEKNQNQPKHTNKFEHHHPHHHHQQQETRPKANTKQKSFHFFGLQKWRKGCEETKERETEDEMQQRAKRKLKFDNVSHALKRYVRMVRPFLSLRISSRREAKLDEFRRQSHSFSGINKKDNIGRGSVGYSSAPASIWTSPTNSGHLVVTTATTHSPTSDSTMEELQAAIQAAIAHCKNSIAMEDDKRIT